MVEAHGQRPLSDVSVNAWVQTQSRGYSYWYLHGRPPSTDAQGRYELKDLPVGATVYLDLQKADYVQQCASEITMGGTPQQLDAQLVQRAALSASRDAAPSAPGFRNVYGAVYENTGNGREPTANAVVVFEAGPDFGVASTPTDGHGRFLLCGLSQARSLRLVVYGSGDRVVYHTAPPGPDAEIEIDVR